MHSGHLTSGAPPSWVKTEGGAQNGKVTIRELKVVCISI